MTRCVVIADGKYLTARRNVGSMYVNRSGWSSDFSDAKIFASKTAAVNSARQNRDEVNFKVFEVEVCVGKEL